jgi:hypothetical protein
VVTFEKNLKILDESIKGNITSNKIGGNNLSEGNRIS